MSKDRLKGIRRRLIHPDLTDLHNRINAISEAVAKRNMTQLRRLAITGPGLVNDGLRRICWPLLLHCEKPSQSVRAERHHRDEGQVMLDVERSFVHYPKGIRNAVIKRHRKDLSEIIVTVLRRHSRLSYYQGFHDICATLLLVLGKESAINAAENIAMFLLRDCMFDSLDPVLRQLSLVYTLIRLEDPAVYNFLQEADCRPHFCISWVITWCSHDIHDFKKVARLFDFFIAANPLMTVYLAARIVLSRRQELLSRECDNDVVHSFLSKIPQDIDVDELIAKTVAMYNKRPPHSLQKAHGEFLEKTSCVNLYQQHWLKVGVDDQLDYATADEILTLPLSTRKPVQKLTPTALLSLCKPTLYMVFMLTVSLSTAILFAYLGKSGYGEYSENKKRH